MNFKSQEYLAKLLAKENLSVQHGNYETASFDVDNRVLKLPLWADKGKDVYDLLVGHEVGHALYTPADGWHNSDKEIPGVPRSMINIIEDIRIEKKIQNTYPGIVRAFKTGYKKLFDADLFGTVGKDLTTYNFMDKLNIHSKGRGYAPIEFNETEQMFADMAMSVETWDDVLNACQEINNWLNSKEDEQETEEEEQSIAGELNDTEELDEGGDETSPGTEMPDEMDPEESQTDKAQRENEGDLLDTNEDGKQPTYSSGISDENIKKLVVTYPMLKASRLDIHNEGLYNHEDLPGLYKEMLDGGVDKTVNLMAKEFERKKAAWEYSRSSEAKKGSLNVNKLHQYQYSEDIFLTVQQLAQAKSHGIFMLVDFSGSMADILLDVIKQTITVAKFCKKVNIPFEAYSFTSGWSEDNDGVEVGENAIENVATLKLVNIISSNLKKNDFNESLQHLWAVAMASKWNTRMGLHNTTRYDSMGATPLVQSLICCKPLIDKFKAKTGVQNMNVMILTDGIADTIRVEGAWKLRNVDDETMKIKFGNKMIEGNSRETLVASAVKILGELTRSKMLGFFLCGNLGRFSSGYYMAGQARNTGHEHWIKTKKEFAKEGVKSYKNVSGYDEFFIVKVGDKSPTAEFEVNTKGGAVAEMKDVKREFRKFNRNTKRSKLLASKITDAVAA